MIGVLAQVVGSATVGPELAPKVIELYRSNAPSDKPMHLWTSIITDQMFTRSSVLLAERKFEQHAAPVYMYSLDWRSPSCEGRLKAHHAMDLPFVFDTTEAILNLFQNLQYQFT